jgi:hypothetical protein
MDTLPTVSATTGALSVCMSYFDTLSNSTPGGAWSSSDATVATVGPSGIVTGVGVGSCIISYTVVNVCGSTSSVITMTVTSACSQGFSAQLAEDHISIYPNPNDGNFLIQYSTINMNEDDILSIEVLNLLGQTVYSGSIDLRGAASQKINLGNTVSDGCYIVMIRGIETFFVNRITVKN